jgi:hypothetical protein
LPAFGLGLVCVWSGLGLRLTKVNPEENPKKARQSYEKKILRNHSVTYIFATSWLRNRNVTMPVRTGKQIECFKALGTLYGTPGNQL